MYRSQLFYIHKHKNKIMKRTIVAMIYDFDGTLSPGNIQEYGFIEAIKKNTKSFWNANANWLKTMMRIIFCVICG